MKSKKLKKKIKSKFIKSKPKHIVLVRKISNDDYFINVNKTSDQKDVYYDATLDLVEKVQKNNQDTRNAELLHKMFLPLIKGFISKYYTRIAGSKYYEYEDFVNEVNCMFFELINEYKPKYNSAKFFVFYIKFMLDMRIKGFITDFFRTPLPSYASIEDFQDIPHHDNVDDHLFMQFFWNKVEEEISKFPKGKQFMKKYFFSDSPCTIKDLNKEFDSNMYVVYDKLKKKLKTFFNKTSKQETDQDETDS